MKNKILSLCLPTNGIIEWVFPVLDSIYNQSVDENLYEVIVTNNGENEKFHNMMNDYATKHTNLIYKKTDAFMFHNQLESLKLASGTYLKFVNHRAVFTDGSLNEMINIVMKNIELKPVMYFSNGVLKKDISVESFDKFVCNLGEFASWTTGVGIWKEDYDNLPDDFKIDKISPHSCILFAERKKQSYKIYNNVFSKEIDGDHSKKGKYDLFKAFGVEELAITQNLYIDGDISADTLKKVKKDYRNLIARFYWLFCIRKKPCSYILAGFDDSMGIYFNKFDIIFHAYLTGIKFLLMEIGGKDK